MTVGGLFHWSTLAGVAALLSLLDYAFESSDGDILLIEKSLTIPQSRARVFAIVSDLQQYPEWVDGLVKLEALDTAPMSAGKHFTATYNALMFGETTYSMVMYGYESPRYVSFLTDCWTELRTDISIDKIPGGQSQTRVTWKQYSRKRSYLFRYTLAPFLQFIHSHQSRYTMLRLKSGSKNIGNKTLKIHILNVDVFN